MPEPVWRTKLTTQQAQDLIDGMVRAGFKYNDIQRWGTLMRPDIYELARYATDKGLRVVLGTNGTLITEEVAKELKKAGFMAVGVSLDSLDPGKNDGFRKLEHAFDLAVQGMLNLKKAGLAFQIHTTVMDWNVDELENITDFALEIGAMAHHVFFLVPTGRGKNIEEEALRVAAYEKTIARLMEKQKTCPIEIKPTCAPQFIRTADKKNVPMRFSKGCLAGISYCIISPKGDVQPCAYLDIPLGNVKETPFDEIWKNNPVLHRLRTMEYEVKCGACDYRERCGGCRARAYFYSNGNIMAEDEWCLYNPPGWER